MTLTSIKSDSQGRHTGPNRNNHGCSEREGKRIFPWSCTPLGRVLEYLGSGISRPFFTEPNGIPVLRSNNVADGKINIDELKYWHKKDPRGADLASATPHVGDILINFVNGSRRELGKAAPYLGVPKNCIVSTNFFIVRLNQHKISTEYLNYFLQSDLYADWLRSTTGFSGPGSFNQQQLRSLRVPLPDRREQECIVQILSVWDRGIEQAERLLALKEQRKRALMQQLLTGKRRFPEFVRSKTTHHTPFGDLPKDWVLVPLNSVADTVKRKNSTGCTLVLTASGQHGLVDQREFFNRSVAGERLEGYYLIKRGEFAYNRSLMKGYPYGAIKRLNAYDEGIVSILYHCFRITGTSLVADFATHLFESGLLNRQLRGIVQVGARAHGLLNVTSSDFMDMSILLPSLGEQRHIAAVLNTCDDEIRLLRAQVDALKQQKKGLMQKLLTGEVQILGGVGRG